MSYEVIYITGPPATGKSTLTSMLGEFLQPAEVFTYSRVLADFANSKLAKTVSQDDLRSQSSKIISPEDVEAVDGHLIQLVEQRRQTSNIIIDSHAVTKKSYGFRVTPFSLERLLSLRPTIIVMLFSEPSLVIERIAEHSQGRPLVSAFDANFHNNLQACVAISYGIQLGMPVYFLDANEPPEELLEILLGRLLPKHLN